MKITIEVDISNIGETLEAARKSLYLGQTKVAAEADMSQTHLSRIEKEEVKSVPFTTLIKIARAVGIDRSLKPTIFQAVFKVFDLGDLGKRTPHLKSLVSTPLDRPTEG